MSKLRLCSIVFIIIAVIAFVPLAMEVFGHMDPDTIIVSARIFGVGILGSCICNVARVVQELKKK